MSEKMIIQNVRCSYVFVDEPRDETDDDGNKTGKKKYSIQPLISKKHPQLKKMRAMIQKVAQEKFGAKVKMGMLKTPLRDGDTERDDEEYAGHYFMNCNGNRKPGMVNKANEPADPDDIAEYCYSGAYFHVSVSFYPFERKGNKGVAVGLNNVMFRKKGERLDGSVAATSEFADYAEEADGDEFGDDDGDDW